MKKIVANITMGNDMSSLFPDVLGCMQTPALDLKKLVYLFLVNYSKAKPEMAVMTINSFVRVSESYPSDSYPYSLILFQFLESFISFLSFCLCSASAASAAAAAAPLPLLFLFLLLLLLLVSIQFNSFFFLFFFFSHSFLHTFFFIFFFALNRTLKIPTP